MIDLILLENGKIKFFLVLCAVTIISAKTKCAICAIGFPTDFVSHRTKKSRGNPALRILTTPAITCAKCYAFALFFICFDVIIFSISTLAWLLYCIVLYLPFRSIHKFIVLN